MYCFRDYRNSGKSAENARPDSLRDSGQGEEWKDFNHRGRGERPRRAPRKSPRARYPAGNCFDDLGVRLGIRVWRRGRRHYSRRGRRRYDYDHLLFVMGIGAGDLYLTVMRRVSKTACLMDMIR